MDSKSTALSTELRGRIASIGPCVGTPVLFSRAYEPALTTRMKVCTKCGAARPLDQFPPVRRGEPRLQSWCRACFAVANARNYRRDAQRHRARTRLNSQRRRADSRERSIAYLSSHPCVDCGEQDVVVLDFDHVSSKQSDVSTLIAMGASWERILAEIARCQVRCANCHRRRTAERMAAPRSSPSRPASRRNAIQLRLAAALATRVCRVCRDTRPLTEFPFRSIKSEVRHHICLQCRRAVARLWYERTVGHAARKMRKRSTARRDVLAANVFGYLSRNPCVDCGEPDPVVLDFDHVRDKRMNVSDLVVLRRPWEEVEFEIGKCAVRCANCHRRKTALERNTYRVWLRPGRGSNPRPLAS